MGDIRNCIGIPYEDADKLHTAFNRALQKEEIRTIDALILETLKIKTDLKGTLYLGYLLRRTIERNERVFRGL